jgi:mannose/cellobiose epimerase-like protein (N-acyl-D-glucosamine 2-epimerase family)
MTHPDVLWELVKDHQARLREEAEHENRARALVVAAVAAGLDRPAGLAAGTLQEAGRHRHPRPWRWFGRRGREAAAGTLAACAPGVAD